MRQFLESRHAGYKVVNKTYGMFAYIRWGIESEALRNHLTVQNVGETAPGRLWAVLVTIWKDVIKVDEGAKMIHMYVAGSG